MAKRKISPRRSFRHHAADPARAIFNDMLSRFQMAGTAQEHSAAFDHLKALITQGAPIDLQKLSDYIDDHLSNDRYEAGMAEDAPHPLDNVLTYLDQQIAAKVKKPKPAAPKPPQS